MDLFYTKILETVIVLILYAIIRGICFKVIDKTLNQRLIQPSRGLATKRIIQIILLSISAIFILLLWGVDHADLAVFIGSVLTVVGVAFFAQWSILSNITSSIILFFNHPVRLNDSIIIMESKDYIIEGTVNDIGLFFISLTTIDGEEITLPNNIFIQKSIKKVSSFSDNPSSTHTEDEESI